MSVIDRYPRRRPAQPSLPSPTDDEQHAFEEYLVSEIVAVCHDPHSKGFYRKLVRTVPRDIIHEALGETRYRAQIGEIRSTRGAFFTDYVRRATNSHQP